MTNYQSKPYLKKYGGLALTLLAGFSLALTSIDYVSAKQSIRPGEAGNEGSSNASVSANGRYVAFNSSADNLSSKDLGPDERDIFMRDIRTKKTVLVSRPSGKRGRANGGSERLAISTNGRYVAFSSSATNLDRSAGVKEGLDDLATDSVIYLRDLRRGTTRLVSRPDGRNTVPKGVLFSANWPSISADGRYVAFDAFSLVPPAASEESSPQIYVRDTKLDRTILVSRADGPDGIEGNDEGSNEAHSDTGGPSISANGRYVAFYSNATNITSEGESGVFVRDLKENKTTLVSGANWFGKRLMYPRYPSISASGRYVVFLGYWITPDEKKERTDVFIRDLRQNTMALVSRRGRGGLRYKGNAHEPSISADGRYVTFSVNKRYDHEGQLRVYTRDLKAKKTRVVNRLNGLKGRIVGDSRSPSISANGRYVSFSTDSEKLKSVFDKYFSPRWFLNFSVYMRDRKTHKTMLISRASGP